MYFIKLCLVLEILKKKKSRIKEEVKKNKNNFKANKLSFYIVLNLFYLF